MDPVEKAIRAVEEAAGKPASEARKVAREQSDKEHLKRADEPWNKRWAHVWRGGTPQ